MATDRDGVAIANIGYRPCANASRLTADAVAKSHLASCAMGRRKGEDTPDRKRSRMPFMAKIRRDDPFGTDDQRETQAMCRRIATAGQYDRKNQQMPHLVHADSFQDPSRNSRL